ncbi:MAG: OsmC family protein [Planctomycetaceae bacterium]
MNADQLRAVQASLKEKYRHDAAAAIVTMHATGTLGEGTACTVETEHVTVVSKLHPAAGGDGSGACSGDMLLAALVACAGVTLNVVATAMGIELKNAVVEAEGDVDFRGTLGVSKEVPVGMQNVRLNFQLDTDASSEQVDKLLKLTERYCVIFQTLVHPPTVTVTRT